MIAVAKTSKTMLNSSGQSGHPCLVSDFRGNAFIFFSIEDNICYEFVIYGFCYVEYVPSIPAFWRVIIINGCRILSKAFSAFTEIIM